MKRPFYIEFFILLIFIFYFTALKAQDSTHINKTNRKNELKDMKELFPNISGKGMMTPTGWGSSGTYIFGYIGGTFPQVYTNKPDLVAGGGLGFGNSYKTVSLVGIFNINNVSSLGTFSFSVIASRHITKGTSLSIGALHILADKKSDAGPSFYIAFSHASQSLKSVIPGYSRLSYTLGIGSGRFYDKSPKDISEGKGRHGTAVFANISYGIFKNLNINAEWSGINFSASVSWRPAIRIKFPFKLPSIGIGVADLIRTSGSSPRLILNLSHSFILSK